MLLPAHAPSINKQILAARTMRVLSFPDLEYFLDNSGVEVYQFHGKFEELRNETMVILHTSGSTGIPKPVLVTHGTFACNDAHQLIPSLGGKPTTVHYIARKRVFLAFPLFHSAALNFSLAFNVYGGVICVLPPPVPLTTDIVDQVHTFGNLHGSLLPPSTIVDLYNNSQHLSNMLQKLEFLAYVGGVLPVEVGDPLSAKTKLITLMGSTETKLLPIELNEDPKDWQYLRISPFLGHEFRADRDGLGELVIVRDPKLDIFQGVFSTFPGISEYPMKDLFEQHPTSPGLWVFRARKDDIICFTNAEKLNPITMESVISAHPEVNAAVIGGDGEFQACLLVEPRSHPVTNEEKKKMIDKLWPTVVKANQDCPAHGRIVQDMMILTVPEKPIPRAGKTTVQRFAALKLYSEELKALYVRKEASIPAGKVVKDPNSAWKASKPASVTPTPYLSLKSNGLVPTNLKPEHPSSDVDVQVEVILHRILPRIMSHHIRPALAELLSNLLFSQTNPGASPVEPQGFSSGSESISSVHLNFEVSQSLTFHQDSQNLEQKYHRDLPTSQTPPFGNVATLEKIEDALCSILTGNFYLQELNRTANLFECGLDSLQIPPLINEINAYLSKEDLNNPVISKAAIIQSPSIEKLAVTIQKLMS